MRRKAIIILNSLFIGGSLYLLIEDYRRVGKFQWVDPAMIDDNEELFLNPICVATIVLGVISISIQSSSKITLSSKPALRALSKFDLYPLSILYGTFSMFVGVTLLSMGVGHVANGIYNDFQDASLLFLMLLIFGAYALMGVLTLYQIFQDKKSS
jgi:hypothetical protein